MIQNTQTYTWIIAFDPPRSRKSPSVDVASSYEEAKKGSLSYRFKSYLHFIPYSWILKSSQYSLYSVHCTYWYKFISNIIMQRLFTDNRKIKCYKKKTRDVLQSTCVSSWIALHLLLLLLLFYQCSSLLLHCTCRSQ